jgi:threonine/homoserine efflux transporter RhtA
VQYFYCFLDVNIHKQAIGQRSIPAERAALIYAMDPVYAAVVAKIYLGETLGVQGVVGAAIIAVAVIASQLAANKADKDVTT